MIAILFALTLADLRVYCMCPNEPLALVDGGDGGGEGRDDARERFVD